MTLPDLLRTSARRHPSRVAVEEPPDGSITYAELDALSDRAAAHLVSLGVTRGDRVGIYLRKSIDTVAAIFGAMKAGAAYVPVDPASPPPRAAYILHDCAVRVVVIDGSLVDDWREETAKLGNVAPPAVLAVDPVVGGAGLRAALGAAEGDAPSVTVGADDLAYILYTSGSTGRPKGVVHNHRNAMAFVDWCAEVFSPVAEDRFSSHAPFTFDLSILDLYVPLQAGAAVVLIGAEAGKEPTGLAKLIADRRLTVWYSTPSILSLLTQYGKLERHDLSTLRLVLFAGEVYPVRHLRTLTRILPKQRYFNLYGPTETNVCTYHEVDLPVPDDRTVPYPIGRRCSNYQARVVDEHGHETAHGAEGELCISGPGVMLGYWNLPEQTAAGFLEDEGGTRWYRTGDIVTEDAGGVYTYVGRRDRMVKRRGYRIELGEIEAGLYKHPAIREAAVVARPDEASGVKITAFVAAHGETPPSIVEMKKFCVEALPASMIPDVFRFEASLPKTSTDKIDYQRLTAMA